MSSSEASSFRTKGYKCAFLCVHPTDSNEYFYREALLDILEKDNRGNLRDVVLRCEEFHAEASHWQVLQEAYLEPLVADATKSATPSESKVNPSTAYVRIVLINFSSGLHPTSPFATPPLTFASPATAFRGHARFTGRRICGRRFTTYYFRSPHPTTTPSSSSRVCARSRNWSTSFVELPPVERSEMCAPLSLIVRSSR